MSDEALEDLVRVEMLHQFADDIMNVDDKALEAMITLLQKEQWRRRRFDTDDA